MALFRVSRAVGKALAAAVDNGIVAPSALYHKNVRYMGILRIMIRNVVLNEGKKYYKISGNSCCAQDGRVELHLFL